VVNLKSIGVGGGRTMKEYITTYLIEDTKKVGIQLPIREIGTLSLKIVVLVLTQIFGSASLHQASRWLMFYVVECLRPMVYIWCTSLLANIKSKLTNCKLDRMRNFRFASILCSFFFERVTSLSPIVEVITHDLHGPAMSWWTKVMWKLGGGMVLTPYNDDFFHWWQQKIIVINDYPYEGIEY
jgi:hypothetical protein